MQAMLESYNLSFMLSKDCGGLDGGAVLQVIWLEHP